MNKSKLKYICFCLFIILACIVINAFTSGIDLKMGLVNEDINKYIIEHQSASNTHDTTWKQGNLYEYKCDSEEFDEECFEYNGTKEDICKDNDNKDRPCVSDNSNDSDDGGIVSTIGNLLNSDKKKCPKLNKVLWGDSWACPAPQPCSKDTPT